MVFQDDMGGFVDGIGVALAAATGAGVVDVDPVVSSAAVAGAATSAVAVNDFQVRPLKRVLMISTVIHFGSCLSN